MKNLFVIIAILVGVGVCVALAGIIFNLYVNSTVALVCYIVGGVSIFIAICLVVVGFINSAKRNKEK